MEFLTQEEEIIIRKNNIIYRPTQKISSICNKVKKISKSFFYENEKIIYKIKEITNEKNLFIKIQFSHDEILFDNGNYDERDYILLTSSFKEKEETILKNFFHNAVFNVLSQPEKYVFFNNHQKLRCVNNLDIEKINYIKFSNKCSAYLFHELIGHLLEKDFYEIPYAYIKKNNLKIPEWLIVKNNTGPLPDAIGVGKYDDFGNPLKDLVLIKNGKINQIIDEGNFIASNFYDVPLPRMRTIEVSSIKKEFEVPVTNLITINKILIGSVNPLTGLINLFCEDIVVCINDAEYQFNGRIKISGELNTIFKNLIGVKNNFLFSNANCIKKKQTIRVGLFGCDCYLKSKGLEICIV